MHSRRKSVLRLTRGVRAVDRAAFTLVELLVVVIIAVILMAVTLPTVKYSLEEGKLREGARQFNAYFASAKARATVTGRQAGVWLELAQIGDPTAIAGNRNYQCTQLFLAEVPAPYSGDYQNSRCYVTGTTLPMALTFVPAGCEASLQTLVADGDRFRIQFDYKGYSFLARRNGTAYEIIDPIVNDPVAPLRPPTATGTTGYAFQIFRSPQRIGQPLEMPQGIVIDTSASGLGTDPWVTSPADRILVMFSPGGGVANVSFTDQINGAFYDSGTSKLHFLVGKVEKVEMPWVNVPQSNLGDGSNLWVTINRRTGSVATVENTPDLTQPHSNQTEQREFLRRAREFAISGDVKGGQ